MNIFNTKKETSKKRNPKLNTNRNSVRIIVIIWVLTYGFFLSTNYIIPENKTNKSDALRVEQPLSNAKSISMARADYCPSTKTLECEFDIINHVYSDGQIAITSMNAGKEVDSQIVYNDTNDIIIQMYKINPQKPSVFSFEYVFNDEPDEVYKASFVVYGETCRQIESLDILTEDEYYNNRIDYDIEYYTSLIEDLQVANKEHQDKIDELNEDLDRLQSETAELTNDEILNLEGNIENNKAEISVHSGEITTNNDTINEYTEIINILKGRKR